MMTNRFVVFCSFWLLLSSQCTASDTNSRVVVFLGDSLTAGYGIDPTQAYPSLIAQKLKKEGHSATIQNAGISGDTTSGGLRRIDWLLRQHIDVLVVALGANDGLRGIDPASSRANLEGIIDKARAKYPEIKVILAGMVLPPNLGERFRTRFAAIFKDIAKEKNVQLIPFLLQGVGGQPQFNLPDGVHPNSVGHEIMAETVWPFVRSALIE